MQLSIKQAFIILFISVLLCLGIYHCLIDEKSTGTDVSVQKEGVGNIAPIFEEVASDPNKANDKYGNDRVIIDDYGRRTYRNETYGYTISCPDNWQIYDTSYSGEKHPEYIELQDFVRPIEGGYSGIGGSGCQLAISVENGRYTSISEWVSARKADYGASLDSFSEKKIKVGKAEGEELIFSGQFIGSGDPTIVLSKEDRIYIVYQNRQDVAEEDCSDFFSQMLSTFTFI